MGVASMLHTAKAVSVAVITAYNMNVVGVAAAAHELHDHIVLGLLHLIISSEPQVVLDSLPQVFTVWDHMTIT